MPANEIPADLRYSRPISGAEKVAVLLLALERAVAGQLLHKLDSHDIELIRTASDQLEPITADDLTLIVDEFASRFGQAMNFLGTPAEMQELLTTTLGSTEHEQPVPDSIEKTSNVQPVWQTVAELEENRVISFLHGEHPQTAAFLLAKTGPQFAALILGQLPAEIRDGLVRRLVNMRPVASLPTAVLESGVTHHLLGDNGSENINRARAQLANIINLMDSEEKTSVLESLLRDKPAEAEDVQRRLFSFEDIEGLPDKSRLTLFDQISADDVVNSLYGASDNMKELVLSSLSSRTRRMVEAELKREGQAEAKQIADARRGIAAVALQMAERGEIVLRVQEGD